MLVCRVFVRPSGNYYGSGGTPQNAHPSVPPRAEMHTLNIPEFERQECGHHRLRLRALSIGWRGVVGAVGCGFVCVH